MLSGDERDRTANFTGCKPGALTIDLTKDAERESCEFGQRLRAARVGPVAGGPAAARLPVSTDCTHSDQEQFPQGNGPPLHAVVQRGWSVSLPRFGTAPVKIAV